MADSPAMIVQRFLLDQAPNPVVKDPTSGQPWGLFISALPDQPDECVAIYDTTGLTDGRIQRTGQEVVHPGIQFTVRSRKYTTGWTQAMAIVNAMILYATTPPKIVLNGSAYHLQCAKMTGPILPLGFEQGTKRRELFTINYILTIPELYG